MSIYRVQYTDRDGHTGTRTVFVADDLQQAVDSVRKAKFDVAPIRIISVEVVQ